MVTATNEIAVILSIYCIIQLYKSATLALPCFFCYVSSGVKLAGNPLDLGHTTY